MFWSLAVLMILLASLFVLVPLWRQQRGAAASGSDIRDSINLGIYEERLDELEQELGEGLIDNAQFESRKLELERLLLVDVSAEAVAAEAAATARPSGLSWRSPAVLIPLFAVLLLPPLSWVAYEQWGFSDELVLRELNLRTQAVGEDGEAARDLVFELRDYIDANPDSGWAWYFMAQNLEVLGVFDGVSLALERASSLIEQPQDKAYLLSRYALNEYMLAQGEMTEKVEGLINEVRLLDPAQPLILQIQALDAERDNDLQGAITYWRRLLQITAAGEEADFLRNHVEELQATLAEQGGAMSADASSGPVVDVEVSLAPGLQLAPETRVFVSALSVGGSGQPLAAEVLTVADLPATVRLDNNDAVGPRNLGSADMVYIVATASISGTANVQAGDYQVRSDGFQHAGSHAIIQLEISEQITEP